MYLIDGMVCRGAQSVAKRSNRLNNRQIVSEARSGSTFRPTHDTEYIVRCNRWLCAVHLRAHHLSHLSEAMLSPANHVRSSHSRAGMWIRRAPRRPCCSCSP